jgi:cytochrome P450
MFDVRNEAISMGNLIEADMNAMFASYLAKAPVHKGSLREHVGMPEHHGKYSKERLGYTAYSFEACNTAFRDNDTYSSKLYLEMPAVQMMGSTLLELVGSEHRRYRATLQPMFIKPVAMKWWRENWIDDLVNSLIVNLEGQQRADLNLDFFARLPVHTVSRGAGMSHEDALTFREALHTMMSSGSREEQMKSAMTVNTMLMDLIRARREKPQDDVISGMIAAEFEETDGSRRPLTDQEIMANCRLFILAGGGTTWRQLGITLWALMTHPEQFEAVKADRSLIEAAIEESVRWNPTDPVFSRLVTKDTVLDGVEVPEGVTLDVCLGAANRDPKRWDNPEQYNLHRPPQTQIGFSIGPHQCLGMHVAKAEIHSAFNALFDHFPNLRLDKDAPAPELIGGLEQRGMSAVPVRLD